MFDTIVWATDGSELADRALVPVMDLARKHHAKIVAVHANELLSGGFGGAPMLEDEPDARREDRSARSKSYASSACRPS